MVVINLAILNKINYKKVGIVSVVLILVPSLLGFVIVPTLLRSQLKKVKSPGKTKQFAKLIFSFLNKNFPTQNLVLKPGSELRELWSEAPFAVTFKVYVFNITNPDDVVQGRKVCYFPFIPQHGKVQGFYGTSQNQETGCSLLAEMKVLFKNQTMIFHSL